jgi:hypothetical protein
MIRFEPHDSKRKHGADGRIARLRDFFHAGYVLDGADIVLLG